MRFSAVVLSLFCLAAPAFCQRGPTPYYEDTNNVPVSPEVRPDRTVTFRLFAPKASEVVLMGSPGILEVIKEPKPLQKDDKGVWSLTVGPLPAGRGPTVKLQTPLSSFCSGLGSLITSRIPGDPIRTTSDAFGAKRRNVTVRSGRTSGETGTLFVSS